MIREAIKNGDIAEAQQKIDEFFQFIDDARNELYIQTGRTNRLTSQDLMGTISPEEKDRAMNKITIATLYCCHAIEKKLIDYFPSVNFKISSESLTDQLMMKHMGRYEQIQEKQKGGSAIFFRGKEVHTERKVMLRVLPDLNFGKEPQNTLIDERLQQVLKIKHRNIIKVLGADLSGFPYHLILEYIDGISLDHLIGRVPFTLSRSLSIFRELCEAVYHLHVNGIVHKKIKPDKVLIDNELRPIISPFDIVSSSKRQLSDSISSQNLMYEAPELLRGEAPGHDFQSDQFSLALLAFELMSGYPLFCQKRHAAAEPNVFEVFEARRKFFEAEDPAYRKKIIKKAGIPEAVTDILLKMLDRNPQQRYPSLLEAWEALEAIDIPQDPDVEKALASYERCCVANPNFTQDFYQDHLFKKPAIRTIFEEREKAREDREKTSQREKMLRIAIDTLIHHQTEPEKLRHILHINAHSGIDLDLYGDFIESIIKCIQEHDALWKSYNRRGSKNPVKQAWENIKVSAIKTIKEK
ncbi:protein kinase domain-containing protein [Flavilitoribacter nigricans]|uniref:Protein kinase domain-containing protein n=1 Tax=Flavilitoribacter nigricans (strain ATCC 23147 / DSM 23189 / NBRC 102662 / NCIMB 1420 / SS-2) TaxID=1122177 RepID=A0A2D0NB41_FLAN2|nr:protein kinase [Flavilitoribacter nigricans]PHN05731.1 hypothetical protein CRP01_14745 [Flavilitoribacter nigricans DSM 23189 = NBRC 102662]